MISKDCFDICMIVHNPLIHDSRVLREASSLSQLGWSVVILSLITSQHYLPSVEILKEFTIRRISQPSIYRWLARLMVKSFLQQF